MNILFLAPRFPLPADTGGKIRTWNILKQLHKQADIHLVCFTFDRQDHKLAIDLKKDGIEVTLVPITDLNVIQKVLMVAFHRFPVSIAKYYLKSMTNVLQGVCKNDRFDAVHVDHLHMAHYLECFNGIPCVIDEHNVEYKILERCANVEKSFIKRKIFENQTLKMKKFEAKNVNKFSSYLAVSKDDKGLLDQLGGEHHLGHVIPNGVDTEFFDFSELKIQSKLEDALVFTGSMDWFPNSDSVLYFIEDILPLIWEKRPEVTFYIVGKNPPENLMDYARKDKRIVFTGRVDDVRIFVQKSKIFVVPLRIGGGTRLKILEAMSMAKAVISTSIGAEGIAYSEDKDIVLADDPKMFAEKVITLLDDQEQRDSLGKNGRNLVLEKYDWNIIGKTLRGVYEKITEKR